MLVQRLPDWEPRLDAAIAAWRNRRHQPRPAHDCASFAAACVVAVVGVDPWPGTLTGYRSVAGQGRALRRAGWRSLIDAGDARLGDAIPPLAAHRGDIVSDGRVLAVMTARGALAFDERGMLLLQPASLVRAWIVGRADAPADLNAGADKNDAPADLNAGANKNDAPADLNAGANQQAAPAAGGGELA